MKKLAIHWFRRDLRIHSNSALQSSFQKFKEFSIAPAPILGVFCFDSKFLSRKDFSHRRFAFFLESLKQLQDQFRQCGGDLIIVDELPEEFFKRLLVFSKNHKINIEHLSFNRDYENFARNRDQRIQNLFKEFNIPVITQKDHLLFEPHEILKSDSTPYQVFTPFSKVFFNKMMESNIQSHLLKQKKSFEFLNKIINNTPPHLFQNTLKSILSEFKVQDSLDDFIKKNNASVDIPIPEAGSIAAYRALQNFDIQKYALERDLPSLNSTSKFSLYLKNSTLTISQIISYFNLNNPESLNDSEKKFLTELVWREFYYHLLWHHPRIEKECFQTKYNHLKWPGKAEHFTSWCEGKTGFPIVDAGMRQLKETGWMHNRVRMIVASFLTKDLHIHWSQGEEFFMKMLLDGDLAPNNGGWQWSASTGCDAQPYFRVFNPWLQGAKFDPQAEYIKKYVPELKNLSPKEIHNEQSSLRNQKYMEPIVDHKTQKMKIIHLFETQKAP